MIPRAKIPSRAASATRTTATPWVVPHRKQAQPRLCTRPLPSPPLAASSSSSLPLSSPSSKQQGALLLEASLRATLDAITPEQRLLPAYDDTSSRAKRRAVDAAEALERFAAEAAAAAAAEADGASSGSSASNGEQEQQRLVLGEWELALAGSGTVVTRTPLVRLLTGLSGGSGSGSSGRAYGLGRIRQVLSSSSSGSSSTRSSIGGTDCCCRASNEVELALGPLLGRWRVAVRGAWRRPRGVVVVAPDGLPAGSLIVDVAFDELVVAPLGRHGRGGGGEEGDEESKDADDTRALRLPLPRPVRRGGVEWATTYVSPEWRVGRGVRSGNVFVFRRIGGGGGGRGGGGG
jgi:hypothetical protein